MCGVTEPLGKRLVGEQAGDCSTEGAQIARFLDEQSVRAVVDLVLDAADRRGDDGSGLTRSEGDIGRFFSERDRSTTG